MKEAEGTFWARGKLVLLWRDFARGQFPVEQWEPFLENLPASSPWRALPDPQGWVPYDELWEALETLARARAWDTYGTRGIAGAQMVFRPGFLDQPIPRSPEEFLERLPDIWDELYRGGNLVLEALLPGHARVRVTIPHPDPALYLLMFSGWIRECLALFGSREPEVTVVPGPHGGQLVARWSPHPSR